tara:strand:- start:10894 stop:11610 length:717 start_codon:yes stop_codon:yes gene_type:complete
MNNLFFIPARKNSKGIKNKNIKKIYDKPLIQHTTNFAEKFKEKYHKKIKVDYFVSTDSLSILKYCKKNQIFEKYLRPSSLSGDKSSIVDAILHADQWIIKNKNLFFNTIILLQPTNPFRDITELKKMLNYYYKNKLKSLISVNKMREHPYECVESKKDNWSYLIKSQKNQGRQLYKNNFYFIDGSYYIINIDVLRKHKSLIIPGVTKLYHLNKKLSIDIDDIFDLKLADLIFKNKIKL